MTDGDALGASGTPYLIVARNRDAYATIRGFVYQVDLTLERWLDLQENEHLELESGEDIDRVSRQLAGAEVREWSRLLEQVKHRVTPITLTSEAVRAALATFYEHRRLNAEQRLHFRFSTNAPAGRERGTPLPRGVRGIEVWQRLAREEDVEHRAEHLTTVRSLSASARKPQGVRDESWRAWMSFIADATDADFLAFVRVVEISTSAGDAPSRRPSIEQRLIDLKYAADPRHARVVYNTLFTSVFTRLTAEGRKTLTGADLQAELAGAGPGAAERVLAAKLETLRAIVEERLENVERGLADARMELVDVKGEVGVLATAVATQRLPAGIHEGDSRTFQLTATYFGSELDPASTFNHARPLVGRAEVLASAVQSAVGALGGDGGMIVLGGPGGVGKSRLLIALASHLETNGLAAVRWVRDRVTPNPDSLNELPGGAVALFCDDAHRRADLAAILDIGEARREATVIVLGTRPRGRDALRVAAFEAGIGWDRFHDLGDIGDLEREHLLLVVRQELGPEFAQWAEGVVKVTHGSTLVGTVGARLLRTRRVHPGILAQDREATHVILSGFEDEIYGRLGADVDATLGRRLLELLSAIAPVSMNDEGLLIRAAEYLSTDVAQLRRTIGVLQEAGVLREQRRGVRIVPDVLSDHILQRTLVAGGRATGAELVILERLGADVLPAILRNAGELDWQLHAPGVAGERAGVDVFTAVWERFVNAFREAPNIQREALLRRLRPVAAFQPAPVVALCQWLVENPEGDETTEWGITHTAERVLEDVPTLLGIVAQHEPHFDRALDLLWRLGRDDQRELNPNPEHPMRVLQEVGEYAPGRYVWRQERAIAALRRWTAAPGWSVRAHSPLVVASAVLKMTMVEDRFDRRTRALTMTRHGVNAEATRVPRQDVVQLLQELVLGPEPRGRILALEVLLDALRPPESQFGHVVSDAEEEGFRAQYEAAFDACERIAVASVDPLVRVKLRDGLQWVPRRTRLSWKKARAIAVVELLPETAEMVRARVWGRQFREAFTRPGQPRTAFQRVGQLGQRLTAKVAAELAAEAVDDVDALLDYLTLEHARFSAAAVHGEPGWLLAAIAEVRSDLGVQVAAWMVSSVDGDPAAELTPWLPVLLMVLRSRQPEAYELLLAAAVASPRARLRLAAAGALARLPEPPWSDEEVAHARTLLSDGDPGVREAAVNAFQFTTAASKEALLPSVVVGNEERVAAALADWWAYQPVERQPDIARTDVARILNEMVELAKLDARQANVDEMLAVFARRYPLEVLEFVLQRARREAAVHDNLVGLNTRYDAVPYGGLQGVWSALQATAEHPTIVRRLLDELVDEARRDVEPWRRSALEIARQIMLWDAELETALREWMRAGRCDDMTRIGTVFSDQPSLFVIEHRVFVLDLVMWARRCGPDVGDRIEAALLSSTSATIRTRRQGEPSEIDVRLRDQGRAIADELTHGEPELGPAAAFFRRVADRAAERLAAEVNRDERALADELDWDDDDD